MNVILVTLDEAYAGILCLFLKSLHRHYPSHPSVLASTHGWTAEMRRKFSLRFPFLDWVDAATLRFPVGPPVAYDTTWNRPIMYARYAAWTRRFDAYDVVLYLDVDTLVLAPLDPLFAAQEVLAFEETFPERSVRVFRDPSDPRLRRLLAEDGLGAWDWRGANGGVLAVPRRYRTAAQFAELERLARRYGPYFRWGDQSLLNVWLARNGIVPSTDLTCNYQFRLVFDRSSMVSIRDVKVMHFNGLHGEAPLLMALASALTTRFPEGRLAVAPAMRLACWRGWSRLPGYRIRRSLRRSFMSRALELG